LFLGTQLIFKLVHEEDAMSGFKSCGLAIVLAAALLIGPLGSVAFADDYMQTEKPTGGMMMWDAVAMRPIGIAATAVGAVVWLVSYPFAALGGNTDESTQKLVVEPFDWTFQRPLGEF
jgi:hypothetical protein